MTYTRLYLLSITALVLAIPASAPATEINADGAAHLKTIFENWTNDRQKMNQAAGGPTYEYDGNVTVEPTDKYYAITMPHARLTYPDGAYLDLGMVSINASPHDSPDQWKMTMAIPTPIIMFGADRQQVTRIDIGAQRAAGLWDESFENFFKLDAGYQNIAIQNAQQDFQLKIPSAQIRYDFTKNEQNRWSGPGWFTLKDLNMQLPQKSGQIKIGALESDFKIDRYDPAIIKTYREQILALTENGEEKPASAEHAIGIYNMLYTFLLNAANGFEISYKIENAEITGIKTEDEKPGTAKIGKALAGVMLDGLLDNRVGINISLGYTGFETSLAPPEENIAPTDVNLKFLIKNVPLKDIADLAKNTLESAMQTPEMKQLAIVALMFKVPAFLSQTGSYAEIKNNYIAGPGYRLDLNGRITADVTAVNSATADLKATFKGLDQLMDKVRIQAESPKNPQAAQYKKLLDTLDTIKSYAAAKPGDNGQTIYEAQFTMDKQGQMLLNGQPALSLFGKEEPKKAKETPPTKEPPAQP